LSIESKVQEGGLNEKRLLNQLLFGEGPTPPTEEAEENVEVPVLGPARSLVYGTGSMVTNEKFVSMLQQDIVLRPGHSPFFFFFSMPKASWFLWAEKPLCLLPQLESLAGTSALSMTTYDVSLGNRLSTCCTGFLRLPALPVLAEVRGGGGAALVGCCRIAEGGGGGAAR
jgi:hypothetical protein